MLGLVAPHDHGEERRLLLLRPDGHSEYRCDLYAYLLRRFLLPTFGKRSLSSIDVLTVRSWLASLEGQGVSASTRAKAYRLLSRVLGAAVRPAPFVRNPCTLKGAGHERSPEQRFATVAEVVALADGVGPRYRALVLAAPYAGRGGASSGAAGRRVDLLHGRVTVADQVAEVNGRSTPGHRRPGRAADRPLPASVAALAEHIDRYAEPGEMAWCSQPPRAATAAQQLPPSGVGAGDRRPA